MKTIYLTACLVFAGLATAALAGAPPCPEEATPCCKPVVVQVVEAKCSGAAKSCAGEKESCSGRSTFAERRAERVEGRCAARSAARDARAAARAGCCGTATAKVVMVCCPESAEDPACCKCK